MQRLTTTFQGVMISTQPGLKPTKFVNNVFKMVVVTKIRRELKPESGMQPFFGREYETGIKRLAHNIA